MSETAEPGPIEAQVLVWRSMDGYPSRKDEVLLKAREWDAEIARLARQRDTLAEALVTVTNCGDRTAVQIARAALALGGGEDTDGSA